jgi:hypothetical protein
LLVGLDDAAAEEAAAEEAAAEEATATVLAEVCVCNVLAGGAIEPNWNVGA